MASAAGSSGCDCEGEDQDDSSSSSHVNGAQLTFEALSVQDRNSKEDEDELSVFRQQWQRELESTPSPQRVPEPVPRLAETTEPLSDEERAKQLFMQGVELERSHKLYEAIQHYKRAMQLVPDIELKLYENTELRAPSPEGESEPEEVTRCVDEHASDDEDAVEGEELLARLQRVVARRGRLCQPDQPAKGVHLSWLPYEVVVLILRWVVSAELDAASLERAAAACRGLYVAARENDLWRDMCLKTWGKECGSPRASGFASWRQMYVERARLLLHGCYISKASYLRHGENSFQDQFYRPWYIVEYYRYLRFFPEGLVLSWTTAEEPAACVPQLRARSPRPGLGIVPGHYRLIGDKVVIILKKAGSEKKPALATNTRFRARRKDSHDHHEQTFQLELQLRAVRGRRNWQLAWRGYSVSTRAAPAPFELSPARFPPFAFSRVRSYTAEAAAPLQLPRHC